MSAGELRVLTTPRSESVASAIETIQAVLDEAYAGNVIAVGIAIVRPDGAVNASRSYTDWSGALLGAVTLLQARMTNEMES